MMCNIINTNSKDGGIKCRVHKNAIECSAINHQLLSPLRQRCFEDVKELVETQEMVFLSINEMHGITFVFYVEDMRNSAYSCVGIEHCHVIRHRCRDATNGILDVIERNDYATFAAQMPNFNLCYSNDYCEDTWLGVT